MKYKQKINYKILDGKDITRKIGNQLNKKILLK